MKLTIPQLAAVESLADIDIEWRKAKATAKRQAEKIVADIIADIDHQRAQAAYRAYQLRVPKVRIYQDGLHTTDPDSLNRIIERFQPRAPLVPVPLDQPVGAIPPGSTPPVEIAPPREDGPFAWLDPSHHVVQIRLRGFPTLSRREGFPEVLEGMVRRSKSARSGWEVIEDPTDQETEFGVIPGFLRGEIDRNWFPEEEPADSHLPTVLNKWAEVAE